MNYPAMNTTVLNRTPGRLIRFTELPVGARFEFRGRRYEKVALSMARDEERLGNAFHAETEVVCDTPGGLARRGAQPAANSRWHEC